MKAFIVPTWKRRPALFDGLPVAVSPEVFDLQRLERILPLMTSQDLACRHAAGAVSDPMPRIGSTDFAGCLGRRLQTEVLSINMSNLHRYDAVVKEVLDRFMDALAPAIGVHRRDIQKPSAAIFLSSPRAITCYHDDRENNFLLHLRGRKTLHLFPVRETFRSEVVKAFFHKRKGIHGTYRPEFERDAEVFAMSPGSMLYIPRLWPHWVENGPDVSASLSLNFFTPPDVFRENLYLANDKLRAVVGQAMRSVQSG